MISAYSGVSCGRKEEESNEEDGATTVRHFCFLIPLLLRWIFGKR